MATRFHFRLESLLKLRKSLEEEAQRHLARMMELQREAEETLEDLRQAWEQALDARRCPPGEPIDLELRRALERFLLVQERRILVAEEDLRAAEARVAGARLALLKAHQAHLTLLRLKERRQEQHAYEVLQDEIRMADEMAVLRHRFGTHTLQDLTKEVIA